MPTVGHCWAYSPGTLASFSCHHDNMIWQLSTFEHRIHVEICRYPIFRWEALIWLKYTWLILGLHSVNERHRYKVTQYLYILHLHVRSAEITNHGGHCTHESPANQMVRTTKACIRFYKSGFVIGMLGVRVVNSRWNVGNYFGAILRTAWRILKLSPITLYFSKSCLVPQKGHQAPETIHDILVRQTTDDQGHQQSCLHEEFLPRSNKWFKTAIFVKLKFPEWRN